MVSRRLAQLFFLLLFPLIFMQAACGDSAGDSTAQDKSKNEHASGNVDWGHEVSPGEMIAMAKAGRIVEIQWHVMPNILRARAADGRIFYLKNEDKGVDLRNALIKAGVKVGEGGIPFRHFF